MPRRENEASTRVLLYSFYVTITASTLNPYHDYRVGGVLLRFKVKRLIGCLTTLRFWRVVRCIVIVMDALPARNCSMFLFLVEDYV